MTTAIGVVMTEHIVAGRMENHKLVGEPVRYPGDLTEVDALTVLPGGELLEILANQITELAGARREAGRGNRRRSARRGPPWSRRGRPESDPDQGNAHGRGTGARAPGPGHQGARAYRQRRRRHRRRSGRQIRPARQVDARVDHRQRHRLRTMALRRRRLGRRPYHRHSRSQGALLRMRRRGTPRGHHGISRHAPALPRPRARRNIRPCQGGRREVPGVRGPVASRAGRRHGFVHSSRRAGALLLHRPQRGFRRCAASARAHREHGQDEPAAELLARGAAPDDETALLGAGVSALRALTW